MPLRRVIFLPNYFYHVYNRGHNKSIIFRNKRDYIRYLTKLKQYLKQHSITLVAYCLMPNHIHLLLRQNNDNSINSFIHRLHTAYTMYFNKKYDHLGTVFQGRFKAKLIEGDEYLLHLSRYIHINPLEVMQNYNQKLEKYFWSSYREYIKSREKNRLCNTKIILDYFSIKLKSTKRKKYQEFVESYIKNVDNAIIKDINEGNLPECN